MSAAAHEANGTSISTRVSEEDSGANDLRTALGAAGIRCLVRGGPQVEEESGLSWVILGMIKDAEAVRMAQLILKGLADTGATTS